MAGRRSVGLVVSDPGPWYDSAYTVSGRASGCSRDRRGADDGDGDGDGDDDAEDEEDEDDDGSMRDEEERADAAQRRRRSRTGRDGTGWA